MEDPGRPSRRPPARMIGWLLAASVLTCLGEPAVNTTHWHVSYPPAANGKPAESTAVPINGGSLLVTVVTPGADASFPSVRKDKQMVPARVLGYDPVSSLSFLNIGGGQVQPAKWRNNADNIIDTPLQAQTADGAINCRANGWIKQVGAKILPLALLQVTFNQAVPSAGTPLSDPQGRIVAIVFQASANPKVGYAIPAEAVHRVRRDLTNGGKLVRGYLGLSLRAENKSPAIMKVIPDSPAAAAGIQPGDVLLNVGTHRISDYADAVNAFFFLVPGQAVRVKLRRAANEHNLELIPIQPEGR